MGQSSAFPCPACVWGHDSPMGTGTCVGMGRKSPLPAAKARLPAARCECVLVLLEGHLWSIAALIMKELILGSAHVGFQPPLAPGAFVSCLVLDLSAERGRKKTSW